MPPIATSRDAVCDAILRFEDELRRSSPLSRRLAYARAWYAHRDADGRWAFGPSKFIGYVGLTAAQYIEYSKTGVLDGRRTEHQLGRWFEVLDPNTDLHAALNAELSAFLAQYGKAPSRKARLHILRSDGSSGIDPLVLDLMVAVAQSLEPSDLARLRARLAVIG